MCIYIYIYIHNSLHTYFKTRKRNSKLSKNQLPISLHYLSTRKICQEKRCLPPSCFPANYWRGMIRQHLQPTWALPNFLPSPSPKKNCHLHMSTHRVFRGPGPQPSSLMIQVVGSPYNPITRQWINGSMVPSNPRASHDRYNAKSE